MMTMTKEIKVGISIYKSFPSIHEKKEKKNGQAQPNDSLKSDSDISLTVFVARASADSFASASSFAFWAATCDLRME